MPSWSVFWLPSGDICFSPGCIESSNDTCEKRFCYVLHFSTGKCQPLASLSLAY